EAVDVEGAAYGWLARNQRTSRPGWPAGQVDHGIGGCAPQLLHSSVSREGRRHPGPLQRVVVYRDEAGPVSPVLRRVLRHQALRNDRIDLRDGAERIPDVAQRRSEVRFTGGSG